MVGLFLCVLSYFALSCILRLKICNNKKVSVRGYSKATYHKHSNSNKYLWKDFMNRNLFFKYTQLKVLEILLKSLFYRVSIKSFPDYKHLLQENYVEYKQFFFQNVTQLKKFFLQLSQVMVKKNMVFFWPCIIVLTCFNYQLDAQFLYSVIYVLY
jgi:hypothetical protein